MPVPARNVFPILFLVFPHGVFAAEKVEIRPEATDSSIRSVPTLGCWFWREGEFDPDGYRPFLDLVAEKSRYRILTTSLRVKNRELPDPETMRQIREAVGYAGRLGLGIALDLDVRLARRHYRERYPDEMQWMVRLRETRLDDTGRAEIRVESAHLSDHYTHRTTPYIPLSGRVLRVYCFDRTQQGPILAGSLEELEQGFTPISQTTGEVRVEFDLGPGKAGKTVCLMAAFEHFTPDVFAPHLLDYQRELIEKYRDIPLAGVCKDEWGFPPDFTGCPEKNDYWYSSFRAEAYRRETGRDLLGDFLLMTYGEEGRGQERDLAINHFLRMSTLRNGEIEKHFYAATKEVFGEDALVATHPTWYPYPGVQEFKKNGLDWWIAERDFAQTDETTPYCVRTSLAKKWNSPVWFNMYYSENPENYATMMWRDALAGGRINYHPPYPTTLTGSLFEGHRRILQPEWVLGDSRIRLLDLISSAPLDCPVAVIFGHARAMNWTGPHYANTGVSLADRFWEAGYPADLIPSSEIWNGSLRVTPDGRLRYGPQVYDAAVFLYPEFEPGETLEFLSRIDPMRAGFVLLGDRTRDFDGRPVDPLSKSWPNGRETDSEENAFLVAVEILKEREVTPVSPSRFRLKGFGYESSAPGLSGIARLIDGTHLFIQARNRPQGDRVSTVFEVEGNSFHADFEGVLGIRFDSEGKVVALAAGGLKAFHSENLTLELAERFDFAVTRNREGSWNGRFPDRFGTPVSGFEKLDVHWAPILPHRSSE